jgi:hypothetical protein
MHHIRGSARAVIASLLILVLGITACGSPGPASRPAQPFFPTFPAGPVHTPTPAGTAAPAPAETAGPSPTPDIYRQLSPLNYVAVNSGQVLVKEDLIDLDGKEPKEALLTISGTPIISGANTLPAANLPYTATLSGLQVLAYDAGAGQWQVKWRSSNQGLPGRAAPLPTSAQGQNLLAMDPPLPVLQLRTETTPTVGSTLPTITLRLYGWQNGTAQPLHMRPAGAGADEDAVFSAAANVELIDIDQDRRAEVVADDGVKTTIWKWDGARFVPR